MVDWQGSEFEGNEGTRTEAIRKRSKHFINTRKLEIKSQNSRLYFDILKNEAHIRLTSSVWHAAFALRYVAVFGIILGVVDNAIPACTGIVHHASPACRMSIAHFGAILLPTIALLSAIASKLSIELFFHYQRVREIVYVLQAWQLSAPPIPDMKKNDNEPPPQT
jgi:hypothetical protein